MASAARIILKYDVRFKSPLSINIVVPFDLCTEFIARSKLRS